MANKEETEKNIEAVGAYLRYIAHLGAAQKKSLLNDFMRRPPWKRAAAEE